MNHTVHTLIGSTGSINSLQASSVQDQHLKLGAGSSNITPVFKVKDSPFFFWSNYYVSNVIRGRVAIPPKVGGATRQKWFVRQSQPNLSPRDVGQVPT